MFFRKKGMGYRRKKVYLVFKRLGPAFRAPLSVSSIKNYIWVTLKTDVVS